MRGIDAAAGLIEVARRRLPEADLRVGAIERALLAIAPVSGVDPIAARRVVHEPVETAAGRFRRADGSYRFENRFRYLVAAVP